MPSAQAAPRKAAARLMTSHRSPIGIWIARFAHRTPLRRLIRDDISMAPCTDQPAVLSDAPSSGSVIDRGSTRASRLRCTLEKS